MNITISIFLSLYTFVMCTVLPFVCRMAIKTILQSFRLACLYCKANYKRHIKISEFFVHNNKEFWRFNASICTIGAFSSLYMGDIAYVITTSVYAFIIFSLTFVKANEGNKTRSILSIASSFIAAAFVFYGCLEDKNLTAAAIVFYAAVCIVNNALQNHKKALPSNA